MEEIERISHVIGAAFEKKSKRFSRVTYWLKWLLIAGSVLAALLHFLEGEELTAIDYIGIAAAAVVFISGVLLLSLEADASEELEAARKAISMAARKHEDLDQALDGLTIYETAQRRARELYWGTKAMTEAVGSALEPPEQDLQQTISKVLEVGARSLRIACGFEMTQHYTLVIFESRPEPPESRYKSVLHCIAHDRSIDCPVTDSRKWPSGVGVGGYSYATGIEIVVSDMNAPELGSAFNVNVKPDDGKLYRSIAAVPILVPGSDSPWGVVVGTSDRAKHFDVTGGAGVHTVEGVRSLAGMVALAVQVHRFKSTEKKAEKKP